MTTAKIKLPELTPGQAGKEQTVNTALSIIDLSIDRYVLDKDLATPPGSPANGDAYIVATGATGAWAGKVGQVAFWITSVGVWQFSVPVKGWSAYVVDEDKNYVYGGASWGATAAGGLANLSETKISSAPNATVPVVELTPSVTEASADFVLRPKGNGAILWSTPDNTTTGGNKRGTNAIDLQRSRSVAANVASGSNSVLMTGQYNTASGTYGFLATGWASNAAGAYSFVGGGHSIVANAEDSGIVAGKNNVVAGGATQSVIGGGQLARINGSAYESFVGAGYNCTINTNGSRSGIVSGDTNTMNATTAFIGGGYNNTVSDTMCGIVSGHSNTSAGAYSFIGSGQTNGTSANWAAVVGGRSNSASATYSFVGGGQTNGASATHACVGGGQGNSASAAHACVGGGQTNVASGPHSCVTGGFGNTALGSYSRAGGASATTRGIFGMDAYACGGFTLQGEAQSGKYLLRGTTTDATATVATADVGAATATNTVALPNGSAYAVSGKIVARENATTDAAAWEFKGLIIRGANAAATSLVAAITPTSTAASAGASTWAVAVTANTTIGGLAVTVTGQAAKTIRWVCQVDTVEVVG